MCLGCMDADKKASAKKQNNCNGKHTPFATFKQLKKDICMEYLKLKDQGITKTQYNIDLNGVIDPPDSDYILAITNSLEGNPLPQQENLRISFI